jgi:hypothetical protein
MEALVQQFFFSLIGRLFYIMDEQGYRFVAQWIRHWNCNVLGASQGACHPLWSQMLTHRMYRLSKVFESCFMLINQGIDFNLGSKADQNTFS